MGKYIPSEILEEEIRNKDISAIKSDLINIIRFDPTFHKNKFEAQLKYVEDRGIKIRVPYAKEVDEYKLNPEDWTKEYLFLLMEWLRVNFAPEERISHIKEVGRVVFKEDIETSMLAKSRTSTNKEALPEGNFPRAPKSGRSIQNKKPENQLDLQNLLIPLLVIVLVIGVLVWIVKKIR